MFDLERAISEWRRQMRRTGLGVEVITELEAHLRDEVDEQIASGADTEQAFAAAVQSLGNATDLRTEFVKAVGDERQRRRRFALAICFVSAGVVAVSNVWGLVLFDLTRLERVVGACAGGLAALYLVAVPFLRRLFPETVYARFFGVMKIAIWIAVPLPIVFLLSASGKIPLQSHPMITLFIWLFYAAIGVSALAMGLMGFEPGDGSGGDSGGSPSPWMPRSGTTPPSLVGFDRSGLSLQFAPFSEELLQIADKEARRLGHDFIGTEHILLGVLAVMRGGLAHALRVRKVDCDSVRTEVERLVCPEPCKPDAGALALTPRARRALEIAGREARKVKESLVTADHVLFGLMLEGSGAAAEILRKLGIQIEQLRRDISKDRLDRP